MNCGAASSENIKAYDLMNVTKCSPFVPTGLVVISDINLCGLMNQLN